MSLNSTDQILLHAILNNPQICVISTGPDGKIQSFNAGAEAMLGYKADEVIGKVTPEIKFTVTTAFYGIAVKPGLEAFTTKATITGATEIGQWTYVRKDRSLLQVLLGVSILRDENGAMQGYVGVSMQMPPWEKGRERRKAEVA